jgi:transcriptional regulator of arginine metabolism
MTVIFEKTDKSLLNTFKGMLKENEFRSQDELAYELSLRGFENISQSKISRMLAKVGAIRTRNANSKVIYQLPDELIVPKINFTLDTIALSVKNNGNQIVLKTGPGGAQLLARVLDSLEDSFGILGTIAGDDTVLVIPTKTDQINDITLKISELLRINTH